MVGRRKTVKNVSDSPDDSSIINLELDIKALRSKNRDLAQSLAELQRQKAQQKYEITSLNEQFFDLNAKHANLQGIHSSIGASLKQCLPPLNQLLRTFSELMQLVSVASAVNAANKSPNKDTRTQAVTPHIVNGLVINNPTITLSRLMNNEPTNTRGSDAGPSTSQMPDRLVLEAIQTNHYHDSDSETESEPMQYVRRRVQRPFADDEDSSDNEEDDVDLDANNEEDEKEETNSSRLYTMQEVDENMLTDSSQNCQKEMTVCLKPLSHSQMSDRMKSNGESDSLKSNASGDSSANTLRVSPKEKICLKRGKSSYKEIEDDETIGSGLSREQSVEKLCTSPDVKKICVQRGCQSNGDNDSLYVAINSPISEDMLEQLNLSNIVPVTKCLNTEGSDEDIEPSNNLKVQSMQSLGLTPANLATSTPIVPQSPVTRLSKKSCSSFLQNSGTPVQGVNMKRGRSSDKKLPQVVLERYSLEKKLSGSPIRKVGDILGVVPITKPGEITKRTRTKRTISGLSDSSTATDSPNTIVEQSVESIKSSVGTKSKVEVKKNKKRTKNKGKENESTFTAQRSPRPVRSARPSKLTEPSLTKKLRRSK